MPRSDSGSTARQFFVEIQLLSEATVIASPKQQGIPGEQNRLGVRVLRGEVRGTSGAGRGASADGMQGVAERFAKNLVDRFE